MTDTSDASDAWRAELEANRDEKDRFFDDHPQSPIPPDDRDAFDGLAYYDPDPGYRVEARLEVHHDPETVALETTADYEVEYERVATLQFELGDDATTRQLCAYREAGEDAEPVLFVPFRDKTTGQQTYHQGRYIELAVDGDVADAPDTLTLDFNLAYNPFCAYSETFACPLPPEENWLETAVEAGEKDY